MEKKEDKLKNKATLRLNIKISLLLQHVFVGLNAHKYMLMDFPREVEADELRWVLMQPKVINNQRP